MQLPAVERADGSARDRAVGELRRHLASGRWPPGTVLQESDLADELRVSKTPVREALLILSERGLVRPLARIGYLIPNISLRDVAEVFAYRELIECQLIADVADIGRAGIDLPEARASEPSASEQAFHGALAALAGGRRMQATLRVLLDESDRLFAHLDPARERLSRLVADHDAVLGAILGGELILARALMTVHLTHMRESLMATLRQRLREQSELP